MSVVQLEHPGLLERVSSASTLEAPAYIEAARHALTSLIEGPMPFDPAALDRVPGGYARNLLFNDERMSVWAMVWSAGARTLIHDHHCSCCFGMLSGTVRELNFRAVKEGHAVQVGDKQLAPGYVECMLPDGTDIHQMINDSGAEAISIHIYGFDHNSYESSIGHVYRAVSN